MSEAVLTEQEQQWVNAAARHYGLSSLDGVSRVSDPKPFSKCHIFKLRSGADSLALKVYPMGWWPDRLRRAHATAEFLSDRGFPAPRPLRTLAGDRTLFIGENPAICTSWMPGRPLWDPLARQWASASQVGERLPVAMERLAVFHALMSEFPVGPTRTRVFPAVDWFSQRLVETRKIAAGTDQATVDSLARLAGILSQNAFDESFTLQHVLVDCHPGQFLFDGDAFTGMVDFDHVATGCRCRDLSKLLSTDSTTLSQAPELVAAYTSVGALPDDQKACLPAGVLRYILTTAIGSVYKALSGRQSAQKERDALRASLQAFSDVLPDLRASLDVESTPGVPESLSID